MGGQVTPPLVVIIPSKTTAYCSTLFASFTASQPDWHQRPDVRVVVIDNGLDTPPPAGWAPYLAGGLRLLPYTGEFVFARAINQGLTWARGFVWTAGDFARGAAWPDVVVMNDDTRVLSPAFFDTLLDLLRDPFLSHVGIFSPAIRGGVGNLDQAVRVPLPHRVLLTRRPICFIAAVVRGAVLRDVGPLDEDFTGYGWEDTDYCRRASLAGWQLGVAGEAMVQHGIEDGARSMHGTFGRGRTAEEMRALFIRGRDIFVRKWGEAAVDDPIAGVAPPAGVVPTC